MNISELVNLVVMLSGIGVVVTEYLGNKFGIKDNMARLLSWIVTIGLGFLSQSLDLGELSVLNWKQTAAVGFLSGLVSNGIFSIELVKRILVVLKARK